MRVPASGVGRDVAVEGCCAHARAHVYVWSRPLATSRRHDHRVRDVCAVPSRVRHVQQLPCDTVVRYPFPLTAVAAVIAVAL